MQPFRRRLQLQASEDGSFPQWREDEQDLQQLTEDASSPSRKQPLRRNDSRHQTWISKLTCVVPRCGLNEDEPQQHSLEYLQHAHALDDANTDNNRHLFLFPVVLPGPSNVADSTEKTGASGEDPSETTLSTQSSDKIGDQLQLSGDGVLQQLAIAATKDATVMDAAVENAEVVPKESSSSSSYYLTSSSSDTSGLPWLTGDSTSYTYDDAEKEQVAVVEIPDEEEISIVQSSSKVSKSSSSSSFSSQPDETLLGIQPRQQRAPSRGPDEDAFLAIPGPPSRPPLQPRQRSTSIASSSTTPQVSATERRPTASSSLPEPLLSKSKQELDWLLDYTFSNNSNERYLDYSERLERLEALIRNGGGDADNDPLQNDKSFRIFLETTKNHDHDHDCCYEPRDHAELSRTKACLSFNPRDEKYEQAQMNSDDNTALLHATESVLHASTSALNATMASSVITDDKSFTNGDNASGYNHVSDDDDDFRETLASAKELLASVSYQGESVVQTAAEQDEDNIDKCQELYTKSMSFADTSIKAVMSGANNDEDERIQSQSLHGHIEDVSSRQKGRGSKSEKLTALISRFERLSTARHDEVRSLPPATIETPTRKSRRKKRDAVEPPSVPGSPLLSRKGCIAQEPPAPISDQKVSTEMATGPKDLSDSLTLEAMETSSATASRGFFWRSHPVHAFQGEDELVDTSTSTNADDPRDLCEAASLSSAKEDNETRDGVEHHSIDLGESRPPVPGLQRYDVRHFI